MIGDRIKSVKERLEKVKRQRGTQRKARERRGTFRVSLVGYTNAGKSRCSTRWSRRAPMPPTSCSPRSTPPRARCGWAARALGVAVRHRGLHPRPAAQAGRGLRGHAAGGGRCRPAAARGRCRQPAAAEQQAEVERVLAEIGAADVPQILVYNKCDLLDLAQPRVAADWIEVHPGVRAPRVFVSAVTGEGLDVLRQAIADAARRRA
jgi:GTPase